MMDITVNELLRRKQTVKIRSDLLALTPKTQQEKASSKNLDTHFSGKESSPGLSCCAVKVGEKRKRTEYGEISNLENRSKSQDVVVVNLGNRRVSGDIVGDGGEESGSGKQLHEADLCKKTLPNAMNRNDLLSRKRDAQVGAAMGISQDLEADKNSGFCDASLEVAIQPNASECAGLKFNDFGKLREEVIDKPFRVYFRKRGRKVNRIGDVAKESEIGSGAGLNAKGNKDVTKEAEARISERDSCAYDKEEDNSRVVHDPA